MKEKLIKLYKNIILSDDNLFTDNSYNKAKPIIDKTQTIIHNDFFKSFSELYTTQTYIKTNSFEPKNLYRKDLDSYYNGNHFLSTIKVNLPKQFNNSVRIILGENVPNIYLFSYIKSNKINSESVKLKRNKNSIFHTKAITQTNEIIKEYTLKFGEIIVNLNEKEFEYLIDYTLDRRVLKTHKMLKDLTEIYK